MDNAEELAAQLAYINRLSARFQGHAALHLPAHQRREVAFLNELRTLIVELTAYAQDPGLYWVLRKAYANAACNGNCLPADWYNTGPAMQLAKQILDIEDGKYHPPLGPPVSELP